LIIDHCVSVLTDLTAFGNLSGLEVFRSCSIENIQLENSLWYMVHLKTLQWTVL